ncbi:hypothetical protein AB3N04_06325 [Alkalihalophilus sp. As8PL]|uniref:Uncharacterized protein n=1 Tax=Alkalihalophilus sp. As8PL TaxID=3237103 RepID=A0AB39BVL0_9BACI
MSKKKKKKKKCWYSNQIHTSLSTLCSLSKIKRIPIREIPDNCELVCVGPFCTLVCYGEGLKTIHCDICDDR